MLKFNSKLVASALAVSTMFAFTACNNQTSSGITITGGEATMDTQFTVNNTVSPQAGNFDLNA